MEILRTVSLYIADVAAFVLALAGIVGVCLVFRIHKNIERIAETVESFATTDGVKPGIAKESYWKKTQWKGIR